MVLNRPCYAIVYLYFFLISNSNICHHGVVRMQLGVLEGLDVLGKVGPVRMRLLTLTCHPPKLSPQSASRLPSLSCQTVREESERI